MIYKVSSVYINTEHVFALAALLGFRFAPRISDALSKKLYLLDDAETSGPLGTLLFDQANRKLISEQWDEMRRVASSTRHGTVSASLLMRKLAAYPRQNQVARALTELGKLERTAFSASVFSRRVPAPPHSDWAQQRRSLARPRPPALLWPSG